MTDTSLRSAAAFPSPPSRFVSLLGSRRSAIVVLTGAFVVSRIGFALAGVRLRQSFGTVHNYWQVLGAVVLRTHFLQSLLYLHIQPPLFDVDLGFLGFLPARAIQPVTYASDWAMGLVFALATYLLMQELRVPRWLALVVALLVEVSPATILYENWQFYTYPTAVLLTVAALSCAKFWRTVSVGWGVALVGSCAAVVLLNSTFQLPWMIVCLAPVAIAFRKRLKLLLVIAVLPMLLVFGWYAKNAVLFGTYTTSSLFGMNVARTTLETAPPGEVQGLVAKGVLTPIAALPLFGPANSYDVSAGHRVVRGAPAISEIMKGDHEGPNLNDRDEIAISNEYLHDDIAFVKADPASYFRSVAGAVRIWFLPTDQYYWLDQNLASISTYARLSDRVLGVQPATITEPASPMLQVSYGAVLVYLVALVGAPFVIVRRRRDRALAGAVGFMWTVVAYTFVVTSLIEYGENNRFRFDLGALPLILALVVTVELVRVVTNRRRAQAPKLSGEASGALEGEGSPDSLYF